MPLVALKKLIKQSQAAKDPGLSARQVKRLMRGLRVEGDKAVIHGLRDRPSNRKTSAAQREKIVRILSQQVYRGFGPTLASEHLAKKHTVTIGREALSQIMVSAGLWRSRKLTLTQVHQWRTQRSCRGQLVQWGTSVHDWLEGRGAKLYRPLAKHAEVPRRKRSIGGRLSTPIRNVQLEISSFEETT